MGRGNDYVPDTTACNGVIEAVVSCHIMATIGKTSQRKIRWSLVPKVETHEWFVLTSYCFFNLYTYTALRVVEWVEVDVFKGLATCRSVS